MTFLTACRRVTVPMATALAISQIFSSGSASADPNADPQGWLDQSIGFHFYNYSSRYLRHHGSSLSNGGHWNDEPPPALPATNVAGEATAFKGAGFDREPLSVEISYVMKDGHILVITASLSYWVN